MTMMNEMTESTKMGILRLAKWRLEFMGMVKKGPGIHGVENCTGIPFSFDLNAHLSRYLFTFKLKL